MKTEVHAQVVRERRYAIHALRINVKSLAAEARLIRYECQRISDGQIRHRLHLHKLVRLRPEARLAQLALAFVRGKPYHSCERPGSRPVDVKALCRKLEKFIYPVNFTTVNDWLTA